MTMSEFSERVLDKAALAVEQGRVAPDEHYPTSIFLVSGNGKKPYRVQITRAEDGSRWITCTCPHGQHHGGEARCYHAAAVLHTLGGEKE